MAEEPSDELATSKTAAQTARDDLATSQTAAQTARDDPAQPARHARLSELFSEAVSLSRTGRDALVDRVREEDSSLAAELAELLAADASAATALCTAGLNTPLDRPANAPPLLELRGYRVKERLGQGGMGTVYAGEQESPNRPVAIKVLHVSSGPALARFYGEAEIMARLDHPGIARVLEAGEANGNPYIVMEHVDGMTLDMHVGVVDPPLATKVKLFAAVCDAVHHAHLNGVIHRDLKPKNIMVRPDGRVVVLDFGIARALAAPQPVAARDTPASASQPSMLPDDSATRAGDLMGTPLYMSPEQAQLRADEVDARSDVYSLGVVLHELVAGELPYPIRDAPLPVVSAMICEDPPASLHARGFDRDLDAIAKTALAKAPEARYQSAAALAADLRAWLDGRAVSVRALGTVESLRRYAKRRPFVAGGVLLGLGVVIAFAAIATHLWLEARSAQHTAETARASLQQRTATLLVQQARARIAADPTEAMTLLADAGEIGGGIDPLVFEVIAEEARGRGVATHVLHEHRDEVHWVEELADGALVTAAYDGQVRLWERPYATSRLLFTQQRGRVHLVRPSPDGKLFAVGGDDGALHVVDRGGNLRGALTGHAGDVERMAWFGDWLVTGDDRGVVLGWRGGAAPSRTFAGATTKVQMVAFGERGEPIVGEEGGKVWRWELDGTAARSFAMRAAVRAVHATNDTITAAAADGSVQRWRGGEPAGPPIETKIPTKRAMISRDGRVVVLAGIDGSLVRVEGDRIDNLGNHATKIRGLAIDATGRRIATGSEDGMIQVWDTATGRHLTLRGHRQRIRHVEFTRTADTLLSSDGEGVVRVWPLETISKTFFHDHRAAIEHVVAGSDGTVISTDALGEIVVTNLTTGASRRVGTAAAHITAVGLARGVPVVGDVKGNVTWWGGERVERSVGSAVRAIAISDDHTRIAVATADGPIALFDTAGTPAGTLSGHTGGTDGLAFDRTGRLLASGGQDRHVRIWRDGAKLLELDGPTGDTHLLRFAPDNSALVTGCDDGAVRAWTVRDGTVDPKSRRVLGEHDGSVASLAFASHTRVVSAARDSAFLLADLSTGTAVTATAPHRNAIVIAVAADGRLLFASETGDVDRWVPPTAPTTIPVSQGTTAAAPLADGRIVLGGADGSLRVIGR